METNRNHMRLSHEKMMNDESLMTKKQAGAFSLSPRPPSFDICHFIPPTSSQWLQIERRGHYFTFFWRADRPSPMTVRFEYRQQNLGAFVQAREVSYDRARGSMKTKFDVIGDDYNDDGRITAWRALLIADGKIVGLTQSYLWQ